MLNNNSIQLHNPSFYNLSPPLHTRVKANSDIERELKSRFFIEGNLYQVLFEGKPSNNFIIEGEASFFIKLCSVTGIEDYQEIQSISNWLTQFNIMVANIIKIVKDKNSDKIAIFFPHIVGTRMPIDMASLKIFSNSIANLHRNLEQYPEKNRLISKTRGRIKDLIYVREAICSGRFKVPFQSENCKAICDKMIAFDDFIDARVLHGDINPGNILLLKNDIVVFLDLEDTLHSVLPIVYELAYAIERFIMVSNFSNAEKLKLGRTFIKAYKDAGGEYVFNTKDKHILQALNIRSLNVLAWCEMNNIVTEEREWDKFYNLYKNAENNQELLKEILDI